MPSASVTAPSASPATTATAPRHFRADIQALRAIAVILVVIYHLRPGRLTGGYIGVDVFFVISGFLITGHLIREATRTGRVRLGAFWAARARRILPASLVAIAVTVVVTAFVAPVTLLGSLQQQALSSIFYVQNWTLAAESVDYSAADNDATAFQHFWSLSVEEQFYLFWPLIVVAALWILAPRIVGGSTRTNATAPISEPRALRRLLLVLFGIVVAASLAASIYAVADGQADAYFVTTTRIWELGAGGMLAALRLARIPRAARYLLAYGGIAAIAGSAFILTNETPFPGLAALPVILGTLALLGAGEGAEPDDPTALSRRDPWTWASRLRITQWVGDRSYSLYLWHFPVIIVWSMLVDGDPGYLDLLGMLVLSVILADLSYRFVEQPVRRAAFFRDSTPRSLLSGLVGMLVVAALTFTYPIITARTSSQWAADADAAAALTPLGALSVTADGGIHAFTTPARVMTPSPLDASTDRDHVFPDGECVGGFRDATTPACTAGDPDSDVSIAFVGDSHVRMYGTAMAQVADEQGWGLTTYMHNRCPFSPVPRVEEGRGELVCTEPNADVLRELLAERPDLVITTWSRAGDFEDENDAGLTPAEGFADYWNQLEDAGIPVLVLRDTPRMDDLIPDCIAAGNYQTPGECAVPEKRAMGDDSVLDGALELAPRVEVADYTDVFCIDGECQPVIGNVIVYSDKHHLTDTFARTMVPRLTASVSAALTP